LRIPHRDGRRLGRGIALIDHRGIDRGERGGIGNRVELGLRRFGPAEINNKAKGKAQRQQADRGHHQNVALCIHAQAPGKAADGGGVAGHQYSRGLI
jgi:hypothetical protein